MTQNTVTLYGSERCHKTQFYLDSLNKLGISYSFHDVTENTVAAEQVRSHYKSKLHFPVFVIGKKWIRNPSDKELKKHLTLNNHIQE